MAPHLPISEGKTVEEVSWALLCNSTYLEAALIFLCRGLEITGYRNAGRREEDTINVIYEILAAVTMNI
jgi:hypothetical protein